MTNEERDIITRLIERVSGAQSGGFGSVPGAQPLPPIDREADALIGELFAKYPEARYRLTQTAFVQEHALAEAANRIKRLEYELQQAQQQAQSQPRSGGFLSGIFGGGGARTATAPPGPGSAWNQGAAPPQPQSQQPPPPPPQYAPGYQPGMFQRQGSGFLGTALTTAAGVAGGMVVGNALMGLFSPHNALAGGLGGATGGLTPGLGDSSPWGSGAGGSDPGYVDQGSWSSPDQDPGTGSGGGFADQGSWDQGGGGGDQTAWNDPGSSWDGGSDSGSFDDNT